MTVRTLTTANLWIGDWAKPVDEPDTDYGHVNDLVQVDGRTWRVTINGRTVVCSAQRAWRASSEREKPTDG